MSADLEKYGAEIVEPYPAPFIESFRAIGYTLASALADIIDNSISATAKNVWLSFKWAGHGSSILIRDDGYGMNKDELIEAMRPGTHHPLEDRKANDLGRFGLGLKTASFSQCRILSVLSKKRGEKRINIRAWNLDFVEWRKKWQILEYVADDKPEKELQRQDGGTIVLWEKLDRVIYDQDDQLISETKFFEGIRETEQHLAMVFHRLLEVGTFRLYINGAKVVPWDPFLSDEKATQSFPTEIYSEGRIKITGYVLPHASKISPEKNKHAAGINGWSAQQGFYIYRKNRLLVAGDWLQLFTKREHTRLARIMIDIDASLDFAWQLDIRKSRAIPPAMFRNELKRYTAAVLKVASEVFNHRGKQKIRKSGRSEFEMAWIIKEVNGTDSFVINRNHPLVRSLKDLLQRDKTELERLLKLLEMTLPAPAIFVNESLNADRNVEAEPPVNDDDVLELMKAVYRRLIKEGNTREKALEELYYTDPFNNYSHLIENLKTE